MPSQACVALNQTDQPNPLTQESLLFVRPGRPGDHGSYALMILRVGAVLRARRPAPANLSGPGKRSRDEPLGRPPVLYPGDRVPRRTSAKVQIATLRGLHDARCNHGRCHEPPRPRGAVPGGGRPGGGPPRRSGARRSRKFFYCAFVRNLREIASEYHTPSRKGAVGIPVL